jgi:hypothetical protein
MKKIVAALAVLFLCLAVHTLYAAEKPLTNDDVVAMIKAGLGDDLVIAKIETSRELSLDVSPDALIKLKKAGISKGVLDAMIRASGQPAAHSNGAPPAADYRQGRMKTGVRLMTKEKQYDLLSIAGAESSTFAYVTSLIWNNYPGLRAEVRTGDRDAYLMLQSEKSPTGRYYLVRLDSNSRSGDRSLKMGREGLFTTRSIGHPDNTWTIPYDVTQEGEGMWRLKPKASLKPDEYGLWMGTGELYDFGVD